MGLASRATYLLGWFQRLPRMVYNRSRIPYRLLRYGHEGLYAELFHNTYRQVAALQQILGDEQFEKALEIGCGYGRMTPWIQEYCGSYEGIDPHGGFLNQAINHFPEASFTQTHAGDIPFSDGHFDLAVAWNSLMYIDIDGLGQAADEIYRLMAPWATLVIRVDVGSGEKRGDRWLHPIESYEEAFAPLSVTEKKILSTSDSDAPYEAIVMRFKTDN